MLDVAINWIYSIDPAIWGSFIAGAMTLSGVLLGQFLIQQRKDDQKEEEIEALRDALAVELRTYDTQLERFVKIIYDIDQVKNDTEASEEMFDELTTSDLQAQVLLARYTADWFPFSKDVYQSNTDKIGRLNPDTAEAVVRAYSHLIALDKTLENVRESLEYAELLSLDIEQETNPELLSRVYLAAPQLEINISQALVSQKMALRELGEEWNKTDQAILFFVFRHRDAQSDAGEFMKRVIEGEMDKHGVSTTEELIEEVDKES